MSQDTHSLSVERVTALDEADTADLCEATDAAIIEGGGFGWLAPQGREALARHFRGVLLVPERELFVARLELGLAGMATQQPQQPQTAPPRWALMGIAAVAATALLLSAWALFLALPG